MLFISAVWILFLYLKTVVPFLEELIERHTSVNILRNSFLHEIKLKNGNTEKKFAHTIL